ncbi:MAG TPA: hypothetical protein DD727_06255, partial [Clostridiales bacterium]|nr:hypothetical protein [Clostridiales bacterium]
DEGYGANEFIRSDKPLVIVTGPGPGSGKLATCLSQLYHEHRRGIKAGYAKFETFPIWNLPLKHPVNVAYEAATADLKDVNMIDPFHLEAYGKTTVNYNRDIEVFPVLKTILGKITGNSALYRSPTDMGVNMAGYSILSDEVVREASCQEIIRRYYHGLCDYKQGLADKETAQRVGLIMSELNLSPMDRKVVGPALEKARASGVPSMAIRLEDGRIITGRTTCLMSAASSMVLNAIKALCGIADEIHLISEIALRPIIQLKEKILRHKSPVLQLEEVLIALSLSAATNPTAQLALTRLEALRCCEVHSSNLVNKAEEGVLRELGVHLTCEPEFPTKDLYFV